MPPRKTQIPVTAETKRLIRQFHNDELNQDDLNVIEKKQVRNQSTYDVFSPDTVAQMDLTFYLSGEQHFKYILTIVDVASRRFDAEPLRNKSANEIVRALRRILDDDGFSTRIIYTDDGSEFNNRQVIAFLDERDIELRITVPGRKNQNAMIEAYNYIFNKMVGTLMTYQELVDKANAERTGRPWRRKATGTWLRYVKPVVVLMNKHKHDEKSIEDMMKPVILGKSERIIPVGTRVRVPYEKPFDPVTDQLFPDSQRFRTGDYRYNPKRIYNVDFISFRPGQPIRYMVANEEGRRRDNVSYLAKELVVVPPDNDVAVADD